MWQRPTLLLLLVLLLYPSLHSRLGQSRGQHLGHLPVLRLVVLPGHRRQREQQIHLRGRRKRNSGCYLQCPSLLALLHLTCILHLFTVLTTCQRDLYAVGWKKMFLEWTARDLYKSWSKGTCAFVNMHTALNMYEPTAKYPIAHPRAFAACSLAGDAQLYERFCCWACRHQVDDGEVKSLWPDMFSFTQHWHVEHASDLQTEWTTLALYGGVTLQDLAWEILGVDLEETPLPRATAALPTIPKVMPNKKGGHNPKIYGPPWYVHQPAVPLYRALPPSYPPPSHLLRSLSAPPQSDFTLSSSTCSMPLLAVNKSLKSLPPSSSTSSHEPAKSEKSPAVTLKAAPSSQRTKVPLPESTSSASTAAPSQPKKDMPEASEDEPFFMKPAEVQQDGTRFQSSKPAQGFTLMGWQNPVMLWGDHLQSQIRSFTHPCTSIHQYSCVREEWHAQNCKPSSLRTWLLRMEEHSFYLFTIKCVASVSMTSRSSLSVKDREKALAMCLVAERDMRDELFTLKSFRYPDSLLPYITSSLEHCRGVIEIRVPMDEATTFPLAPTWTLDQMPIDDEWKRSMYKEL